MQSHCTTETKDTAPELPLISVAALRSSDPEAKQQVADALGAAAQTYGFFRISDHGISRALIEETYHQAARFFTLPEAQKRLYYIGDSTNHRGYVPFSEKGDYSDEVNRSYEAFDMGVDLPQDDPDYLAGNRLLGPNVWPILSGFKPVVAQYYHEISSLGRLITEALELHLGLPKGAMSSQMDKPISQLRLLHYVRKSQRVDHGSVNMGAHTDYECLTLLHTRNPGLQVLAQDDTWIDVPVDHNVYVCNIGDMLEAWSNGILKSTPHRVVNSSAERYSMPYFIAANHDAIIKPFPQLVTADRPAAYQPFKAGDHLERMLIRDFPYLRAAVAKAKLKSGVDEVVHNPFEHRFNKSPA